MLTDIDDILPDLESFYRTNATVKREYKIKRWKFALNETQRNEIISVATKINSTHGLMIKTQLMTGMRVGEMADLLVSNINFKAGFVSVETHDDDDEIERWQPKTESSVRMIPLEPALGREIQRYLDGRGKDSSYVFTGRTGTKFSSRSIINFINLYAKKCSTIGRTIGSHSLRRTYASFLVKHDVPIGTISSYLGHSSIRTTMRYLFEIIDFGDFEKTTSILSTMVDK
jgi:integrase